MLPPQRRMPTPPFPLAAASALLLALLYIGPVPSNAFSLRPLSPPPTASAFGVATTGAFHTGSIGRISLRRERSTTVSLAPLAPTINSIFCSTCSSSSSRRDDNHGRRLGPLYSSRSSSDIIPYYEELMERLPSQSVLNAVEKAKGGPVVASGELGKKALFFFSVLLFT